MRAGYAARAVEDRVCQLADPAHGGGQIVGGRGEQVDGLPDVTPTGADTDLESPGQAGVGIAVAQVGQGEQGLTSGVEAPPSGPVLVAVLADEAGEVVQGSGG
jgi:hypothetical protein